MTSTSSWSSSTATYSARIIVGRCRPAACKRGEALEESAQRELIEEIGYRAGSLQHINSNFTSKSVCREVAHLFIGRDLARVNADDIVPDETEFLEVGILPFRDVLRMVLDSEIRDSMTAIAVLHAARRE